MGAVLYAILECSDRSCDAQYEAWGEPEQLEGLTCELCGAGIEAVAYCDADDKRGRRADVQQRDVA
jgi:hypothetical protein